MIESCYKGPPVQGTPASLPSQYSSLANMCYCQSFHPDNMLITVHAHQQVDQMAWATFTSQVEISKLHLIPPEWLCVVILKNFCLISFCFSYIPATFLPVKNVFKFDIPAEEYTINLVNPICQSIPIEHVYISWKCWLDETLFCLCDIPREWRCPKAEMSCLKV